MSWPCCPIKSFMHFPLKDETPGLYFYSTCVYYVEPGLNICAEKTMKKYQFLDVGKKYPTYRKLMQLHCIFVYTNGLNPIHMQGARSRVRTRVHRSERKGILKQLSQPEHVSVQCLCIITFKVQNNFELLDGVPFLGWIVTTSYYQTNLVVLWHLVKAHSSTMIILGPISWLCLP